MVMKNKIKKESKLKLNKYSSGEIKKLIPTEKIIIEPATKKEVMILEKLILFLDVVSKRRV